MSGATTGAASGALSGATTGAALGPWGAAAGAVIGGVAGGLQGRGADKKRKAQEAAMEAMRRAQAQYGTDVTDMSAEQTRVAQGVDQEYRDRLLGHVQGQQPRDIPGRQAGIANAFTNQIQQGMGPAPVEAGGYGVRGYDSRVYADELARAQASMQPQALGGARGDAALAEQIQALQYAQAGLGDQRQIRDVTDMGAMRNSISYENLMRAMAQAGLQQQQAERAGSREMLMGGLLQAGGNLAGGMAMNASAGNTQAVGRASTANAGYSAHPSSGVAQSFQGYPQPQYVAAPATSRAPAVPSVPVGQRLGRKGGSQLMMPGDY